MVNSLSLIALTVKLCIVSCGCKSVFKIQDQLAFIFSCTDTVTRLELIFLYFYFKIFTLGYLNWHD